MIFCLQNGPGKWTALASVVPALRPAPLGKLVIRRAKRSDPLHTQTSWSRNLGALIPNYGVMAALDQVRDLSVSVESLANPTTNSITLINTQLSSTRLMVLQNRAALDYLLAAVGGTCKVVGPKCCTDITDVHHRPHTNAK